ncbi:hypothetical protein [Mycoplasmopsis verecunda]|uniref:Uncharacterized protein n=1 Tax=Mycoplasmopsis verecunda TaxID=171291 RepID=A0A1T4M5W2_9BACT|nr:hypothetical protein [Mycoplasmopsis verecunda]WPB54510.1 hypothetical protein SAM46_03445 [Mycoplasmopsis verecunda]SJZ62389.1 hypothetical protein SAMN02745154_00633 [Mycoplasmopsis verecunda]
MTLNELQKIKTSDLSDVTPGFGIMGAITAVTGVIGLISQFVSLYKSFRSSSGQYKTKEAEYKWDDKAKNEPRILENYILF